MLVRRLVLQSIVAITVVAIFAVVAVGSYRGFAESQDFYPTEHIGGWARFNNLGEAEQYMGGMIQSVGGFLASRLSRELAASQDGDVHYLNRSVLKKTPLELLINRTVAVVERRGVVYAVVLPEEAPRPAFQFEVYEARTGRRINARIVEVAKANSTYIVPIDENITARIKVGGVIYRITIRDVETFNVVVVWNYYGIEWYMSQTWVASVYAAGYFSVNLGQGVADILPDGWVGANYNIVTVCQSDEPGKVYYSSGGRYGAVQVVAVHANYWCPGSTALVSYPWIAIDGAAGQWIYPKGVPGYKSWSPTYCVCSNIDVSIELPFK